MAPLWIHLLLMRRHLARQSLAAETIELVAPGKDTADLRQATGARRLMTRSFGSGLNGDASGSELRDEPVSGPGPGPGPRAGAKPGARTGASAWTSAAAGLLCASIGLRRPLPAAVCSSHGVRFCRRLRGAAFDWSRACRPGQRQCRAGWLVWDCAAASGNPAESHESGTGVGAMYHMCVQYGSTSMRLVRKQP